MAPVATNHFSIFDDEAFRVEPVTDGADTLVASDTGVGISRTELELLQLGLVEKNGGVALPDVHTYDWGMRSYRSNPLWEIAGPHEMLSCPVRDVADIEGYDKVKFGGAHDGHMCVVVGDIDSVRQPILIKQFKNPCDATLGLPTALFFDQWGRGPRIAYAVADRGQIIGMAMECIVGNEVFDPGGKNDSRHDATCMKMIGHCLANFRFTPRQFIKTDSNDVIPFDCEECTFSDDTTEYQLELAGKTALNPKLMTWSIPTSALIGH